MPNIIETAVAAGNFTTLVEAVKQAGLVETLSGPGPFTVFAPNDEAFAKLDSDTIQSILGDKELLTKVLTYHVVSGKHMAQEIIGMGEESEVKTVNGENVTVSVNAQQNKVMVNNSNVIATDIEASNGVIHVIDTVLVP